MLERLGQPPDDQPALRLIKAVDKVVHDYLEVNTVANTLVSRNTDLRHELAAPVAPPTPPTPEIIYRSIAPSHEEEVTYDDSITTGSGSARFYGSETSRETGSPHGADETIIFIEDEAPHPTGQDLAATGMAHIRTRPVQRTEYADHFLPEEMVVRSPREGVFYSGPRSSHPRASRASTSASSSASRTPRLNRRGRRHQ
jgi:hypothetical protein